MSVCDASQVLDALNWKSDVQTLDLLFITSIMQNDTLSGCSANA